MLMSAEQTGRDDNVGAATQGQLEFEWLQI